MYEQLAAMVRYDDDLDQEGQHTETKLLGSGSPTDRKEESARTEFPGESDPDTKATSSFSVRSMALIAGFSGPEQGRRPIFATVAAVTALAVVFCIVGLRASGTIVPHGASSFRDARSVARSVASAAEVKLPMMRELDEDAIKPKNLSIQWAKDPAKCLDVGGNKSGANLQLWHCAPEDSRYKLDQKFILPKAGGTGFIRWAAHPDLCLDAPGGEDLQFWTCRVAPARNMLFTNSPDGRGRLHLARFPHLCVNVPKVNKNGEKAVMWNCSDMSSDDETARTKFVTDRRHCEWSEWSHWSVCSVSCGGGNIFRSRKVLQQAVNGGDPCGIKADESKSCNTDSCHGDHAKKKSSSVRSATLWSFAHAFCCLGALEWALIN